MLKVIPLAVIAIPAFAGAAGDPQFVLDSQTVNTLNQNSSGGGYFYSLGDGSFSSSFPFNLDVNGYQGLSLTGTVRIGCTEGISCGGETIDLGFTGHLEGSGPFPTSGNLAYAFSVFNTSGGASSFGYSILSKSSSSASYGDAPYTGSDTFTIDGNGNWSLDLLITPDILFAEQDAVFVDFPSTGQPASLDLTVNDASTVPEPSTVALGLGGIALLPLLRRKRKA
jgi:hypothetical protein